METITEKMGNCEGEIKELKTDRDDHDRRITNLEISNSSILVEIKHLIQSVNGLVSMLKWGFGVALTTLLGFFIWYIQKL